MGVGGVWGKLMGLIEAFFLPQIYPEIPGNGGSDVPDFKSLWASMPPGLSCL